MGQPRGWTCAGRPVAALGGLCWGLDSFGWNLGQCDAWHVACRPGTGLGHGREPLGHCEAWPFSCGHIAGLRVRSALLSAGLWLPGQRQAWPFACRPLSLCSMLGPCGWTPGQCQAWPCGWGLIIGLGQGCFVSDSHFWVSGSCRAGALCGCARQYGKPRGSWLFLGLRSTTFDGFARDARPWPIIRVRHVHILNVLRAKHVPEVRTAVHHARSLRAGPTKPGSSSHTCFIAGVHTSTIRCQTSRSRPPHKTIA